MNIQDIRNIKPCYDPSRYLPEDWEGTVLDILRVEECPAQDRLWVICAGKWVDNKAMRLWAVWCARWALDLAGDRSPHSLASCDVAERFANGDATIKELSDAWYAAYCRATAWEASWAAVWVSLSPIYDAAWGSVKTAVNVATENGITPDAAWSTILNKLVEMLEA
jgi:hypothetical protein